MNYLLVNLCVIAILTGCGFFSPKKKLDFRQASSNSVASDIVDAVDNNSSNNDNPESKTPTSDYEIEPCSLGYAEDILPMLKANCISCHSNANASGGVNFELALPEITSDHWQKALTSIQNGTMPAGRSLDVASRISFETWYNMGRPQSRNEKPSCEIADELGENCDLEPFEETVFAISFSGYKNTLEHYFTQIDSIIPKDKSYAIFQDMSLGHMSQTRFDVYSTMAEEVSGKIIANPGQLAGCTTIDRNCAEAFINTWYPVLNRRTLDAAAKTKLMALFDGLIEIGDSPSDGLKMIIDAMLLNPSFIYRRQSALNASLSPIQIITELSVLLKDCYPDASEVNTYLSKETVSDAEIKTYVENVLNSVNSQDRRNFIENFLGRIFRMEKISGITKVESLSDFNSNVRLAMEEEMRQYLDVSFASNTDTLNSLFTSTTTFANSDLGAIYGIDIPGNNFQSLELNDLNRVGIQSKPGLMAVLATEDKTHPIARGNFVRTHLLCLEPGELPESFETAIPEEVEINTRREEIEYITRSVACQVCHSKINPTGFGFEHFNAIGQIQTTEGNAAIDSTGKIVGTLYSDETFNNMNELGSILSSSLDVKKCFAKHAVNYIYNRQENQERCMQKNYTRNLIESNGSLKSVIIEALQSPLFRQRR